MSKRPEGSHEQRQALGPALVRRFGRRKADRLVRFVVGFGILVGERSVAGVEEPVRMEDYAERWGLSRAQAYRELQLWRKCFPDEAWPVELWSLVRDEVYGEDLDTAAADGFASLIPVPWTPKYGAA